MDAPIYGGRCRSLFEDLPPLRVDENALHTPGTDYASLAKRDLQPARRSGSRQAKPSRAASACRR